MIKRLLKYRFLLFYCFVFFVLFTNNAFANEALKVNDISQNETIKKYLLVVFDVLLVCSITLLTFLLLTQKSKSYRFKQLSSATFEGIIIHNNGKILDVNPSFEKMSGYRHDELVQMSVFDFIDKDVYNSFVTKAGSHFETYIKVISNENILVEILEKPYAISRKAVKVIALRDITAFNKMLEQNRLLSAAVDQSANTVVITDKLGVILYVNPKFTKLTGYLAEEVMGKSPSILKSGEQSHDYYQSLCTNF